MTILTDYYASWIWKHSEFEQKLEEKLIYCSCGNENYGPNREHHFFMLQNQTMISSVMLDVPQVLNYINFILNMNMCNL